ncbi:uncharacterized protein FOMMEDRAFT_90774, partial [Fomitiporia mediterranea MF3/22]|uniref:uncharacterized protein n=1 Tax=Fomitiporia mediterranea (strain MF3/22) TaxID=694068 RepID=UPI0004407F16
SQSSALADFLRAGFSLLPGEPKTLQWYALKYESASPTYAIFDTFAEEEGRAAHLNGEIESALVANAPTLVAGAPQINKAQVLASKVQKADVKLGLRVLAEAKPNKVEDAKQFLIVRLLVQLLNFKFQIQGEALT